MKGGGGEEEGVVVTRSVYRATCHPLYQRVSRRQQKLRRIGRDWGMSGVADTVHKDDDDIHDEEYLISQSQAKKSKDGPRAPIKEPL